MNEAETNSGQTNHLPSRVRLPGFVSDEEIGLGDAIKRVTPLGSDPAAAANAVRRP